MQSSRTGPQSIRLELSNAHQRADRRCDPANRELQGRSSGRLPFHHAARQPWRYATSLVGVPLFQPWVPIDVIAEVFPKARLVVRHQRQAPHPFGALPEIKMRDEKARGAAVFRGKICTIKFERDPGLLVDNIFHRKVCCVVAIRTEHRIGQICLYICKQDIKRDPFPRCTEFRPSRYAMDINRDGLGGQLAERLPIPSLQNITAVVDGKFPAIEGYVWSWSCRQHGEISSKVLTGWEFCICCAASTGKTSRDDSHRISYSATDVV